MVSNKVMTVAIVAVVVVAAVGAFLLLDNEEDVLADNKGRLQVYGNANGDDFINSDDIKAVDLFIDEGWDSEEFPFADANMDGLVNDDDKVVIQDIIDKKPMRIKYVDGNGKLDSVKYPIDQIGLAGTQTMAIPSILDVVNRVGGRCDSSSMDPVIHKEVKQLDSLGPRPYELDIGLLGDHPRIDVIVTQMSSTYDEVEEVVESAKKDCIRIDVDSTEKALHAYLLLGFLLDASERASEVASFYDKIQNDIDEKLKDVAEKDRKKTLSNYSYSLCGVNYYPTICTINGGGVNLTTFEKNTQSIKDNQDVLREPQYVGVEYQFCYSSMGFSDMTVEEKAEDWNYYAKYFTYSSAYYENYYVINKDMPDICRSAYVASVLYPEIFGADYGDKVMQEWMDEFYDYVGEFDVKKNGSFCISYDMVKDHVKVVEN